MTIPKKSFYCRTCHIEVMKSTVKFHISKEHELDFIWHVEIPFSETLEFGRTAEELGGAT